MQQPSFLRHVCLWSMLSHSLCTFPCYDCLLCFMSFMLGATKTTVLFIRDQIPEERVTACLRGVPKSARGKGRRLLTASRLRRGQDKKGRRRSAAIPIINFHWNMWGNKCGNI